jgi:xanthine dehydrogenase iron-sulfur cluster and FAD-binding subunit A
MNEPAHTEGGLAALEDALGETGGEACAGCTPRVLDEARALFASTPRPSHDDLERVLVVSRCNCSGYKPVLEAMLMAAGLRRP